MRKAVKGWPSCCLYVITLVSGAVIGLLSANWNVWSLLTKLFAMATALLPLHSILGYGDCTAEELEKPEKELR